MVNTPGNLLTSTDLADYSSALGERYGFEVEILEKEDMLKLGMGALLAVNKGSVEPPKMIVLKYQGKDEWKDVIGLVGKGITFDTGGYSLKTKAGIVGMKTDMGGAAAVLGAMEIIGELGPDQNVVAVIPSTDNMISGDAFKPDDVITAMSGKTIEVLNTDAEGRLVLADAMTYAKHHGADYLIDVATLTGGVITALGMDMTGAMTNDTEFYEQVVKASEEAGEPIWRLPITEKDKERVRNSKIADLNNSPGGAGHAIMGGAFIGEFAEDTRGSIWILPELPQPRATPNCAHRGLPVSWHARLHYWLKPLKRKQDEPKYPKPKIGFGFLKGVGRTLCIPPFQADDDMAIFFPCFRIEIKTDPIGVIRDIRFVLNSYLSDHIDHDIFLRCLGSSHQPVRERLGCGYGIHDFFTSSIKDCEVFADLTSRSGLVAK